MSLSRISQEREGRVEPTPAGLLERAVALCREWHVTTHTPIVMASLGHVYVWSGRMAEGISCRSAR